MFDTKAAVALAGLLVHTAWIEWAGGPGGIVCVGHQTPLAIDQDVEAPLGVHDGRKVYAGIVYRVQPTHPRGSAFPLIPMIVPAYFGLYSKE